MEEPNKNVLAVNVIQALSSSAANASTQSHPVNENLNSNLDSTSTSHSEGDAIENVPPPPPPLGIESQFDMLQISNTEHKKSAGTKPRNNNEIPYSPFPSASRKTIFQKLHNLGLSSSASQSHDKQSNKDLQNQISLEEPSSKDKYSSAYTSSHFATLRKNSNEKRAAFIRGISIEEGLEDSKETKCHARASRSSITRKSLTDYSDIETKISHYNDSSKTRSGSMSSLSSRGSTLSWFRKRSRNQEKGKKYVTAVIQRFLHLIFFTN